MKVARSRRLLVLCLFSLSSAGVSGCMIKDEITKLPKKGKTKKKGSKGTTGAADPTDESGATVGSSDTAVEIDDEAGVCADAPDFSAECASANDLRYCDSGVLYADTCDAFAESFGYPAGVCFETETVTDCFVCDGTTEGTRTCCSVDFSTCCDDAGECFAADDEGTDAVDATDGVDATDTTDESGTDGTDGTGG